MYFSLFFVKFILYDTLLYHVIDTLSTPLTSKSRSCPDSNCTGKKSETFERFLAPVESFFATLRFDQKVEKPFFQRSYPEKFLPSLVPSFDLHLLLYLSSELLKVLGNNLEPKQVPLDL